MVRAVINSAKRVAQYPLATVTGNMFAANTIAVVRQSPDLSVATQVAVGTVIKAVYVELWINAGGMNIGSVVTTVEKSIAESVMTFGDSTNINGYVNKKNIFEIHQGSTAEQNANPVPFFRGWIKIPKGKQRFGLGDSLLLNISALADDVQFCGVAIFKAYN